MSRASFEALGYRLFETDARLADWVGKSWKAAEATTRDPDLLRDWLQCEGTWFVGVNALPNGADGAVPGGPSLAGEAVEFATSLVGHGFAWDRAQVSVCYPGYPKARKGESDGAFRYRRDRDAAHVDGLHPVGPTRERMLKECHAFLLGIPMNETAPNAAPFVIWEGSHHIVARHLRRSLAGLSPAEWGSVALTKAYHAARAEVFETCRRVSVHARPGQAYVVHRLALHGVAPWADGAFAKWGGRMIAYFRPEAGMDPEAWLNLP